jgi:hypothetical protein
MRKILTKTETTFQSNQIAETIKQTHRLVGANLCAIDMFLVYIGLEVVDIFLF